MGEERVPLNGKQIDTFLIRENEIWIHQITPSLEIIRIGMPDMKGERVPLPAPEGIPDVTALASLRLSAASDRWVVTRRPGRLAEWRLLVFDRTGKRWQKLAQIPTLFYRNVHHSTIIGDWYYASYEDSAAGDEAGGLLRVMLKDGTVEFLTNSEGRGTLTGDNPPKIVVTGMAEFEPGVLWIEGGHGDHWRFEAETLTWKKLEGRPALDKPTPPPARMDSAPPRKSTSKLTSEREYFLQVFDPVQRLHQRVDLELPDVKSGGGPGEFHLAANLPSGILLLWGAANAGDARVYDRIGFLPREELDGYLSRIPPPAYLKERLVGLPKSTFAAFTFAPGETRASLPSLFISRDGTTVEPAGSGNGDLLPRVSPNGKRVMHFVGYHPWLFDPSTGRREKLGNPNAPGFPSWSPDGSQLVMWVGEKLHLCDLEKPPEWVPLLPKSRLQPANARGNGEARHVAIPRWSPDGKFIAVPVKAGKESRIAIIDIAAKTERSFQIPEAPNIANCAWSPDSSRIAYITFDSQVGTVGADGENVVEFDAINVDPDKQTLIIVPPLVAWSPDGKRLAFWQCLGNKPVSGMIDLASRKSTPIEESAVIHSGSFLPDSTWVYTSTAIDVSRSQPDDLLASVFRLDPPTGRKAEITWGGSPILEISFGQTVPVK